MSFPQHTVVFTRSVKTKKTRGDLFFFAEKHTPRGEIKVPRGDFFFSGLKRFPRGEIKEFMLPG